MTDPFGDSGARFVRNMKQLVDEPESYEAFARAVNQFAHSQGAVSQDMDTDMQSLLEDTLQQVSLLDQIESLEGRTTRQLAKFFMPSLLVREDGMIVTGNNIGIERLGVQEGDHVRDLDYALDQSADLGDVVRIQANPQKTNAPVLLRQAHHRTSGRIAAFAFVPTLIGAEQAKGVFLFVIDPLIRQEAVSLIAESYGLTDAETDIMTEFANGRSLNEIADARGRARVTVRTQFQSVLEKTGLHSQPELMRVSHALSHFVADIEEIETDARQANRKRLDILRQHGRSVDVLMAGDFSGRPVIFMPGAFLFGFTSDLELAFRKAGLCVFSVARPGFGRTDPCPDGLDLADCIAQDIVAVLDQVGAATAPFLVHSTGIPSAIRAGRFLEGVVQKLVVIGGLAPPDIMRRNTPGVAMTAALFASAGKSKTLLKLLLSARHRLFLRLGTRQFLLNQYEKCPVDQQQATRPDFIAEYELAAKVLIAQGFTPGTEELLGCQGDWSASIEAFPAPIKILHGALDPLCPIAAMQDFAAAYPRHITLSVHPDVGHFLVQRKPGAVLAELAGP